MPAPTAASRYPLGPLSEFELRRIRLELVTPFRTSFGSQTERDILLVRARFDDGDRIVDGWGECVCMSEPLYSAEYVDGAQQVIERYLAPMLFAAATPTEPSAAAVSPLLGAIRGHPMAKAAVEMAILDAQLRWNESNYAEYLGVGRNRVPSGVSVGIFDTIETLLSEVSSYVEQGYCRIKLKIEPGWDIEPVAAVRDLIGSDLPLQVDANSAYSRTDIDHLCRLDEFDLLLIEQPLAEEDLLGHARLAEASSTPICLDESIISLTTASDAIDTGAAEIINIKPGRVGGYLEARRIHDLSVARDIPVWCGGMLETGIGRAANCALAALDGFTLPGDISASSRFYARDIVTDPIVLDDGHVAVPAQRGLGFELDHDFLDAITTATAVISP
jgi:O-succinylbenzoate synthase